jgi:hypothetical protein
VSHVHVNEILWGFSPTLVVKGGLDQHIRLIASSHHSRVTPFTRSKDERVSGMVVGVVRSACRVHLSRLDSGHYN